MASIFDSVVNILGNVMLEKKGLRDEEGSESYRGDCPEIGQVDEINELKEDAGSITTILGRPKSGKSIVSRRVAELIGLPVYAVSPKEKPPNWITGINFEDTKTEPPPHSVLILDDALEYASTGEYGNYTLALLNKNVFTVRHERKIHIIWCAQTSGLLEKFALHAEMIVLKPPSIFFEDLERPHVRKMQRRVFKEVWAGKTDFWLKRHAYVIGHTWAGVVRVNYPKGIIQGN